MPVCPCVCNNIRWILWCVNERRRAKPKSYTVARMRAGMKNKVREKRENLIEKFERTNL